VVTEYFGNTLGHEVPDVPANQIVDFMVERNQWIVGTPDDCVAGINRLLEASGGFGGLLIRVEDWAPRDKIHRSYELLARYVMPQFQGSLVGIETSNRWASQVKDTLQVNRRAGLQAATDAYLTRRGEAQLGKGE
jgi:limonene 1,2-monooxygenase